MNRYSFMMRVKAGQEEEYARRHKEVWPSVKLACKRAGIRNYSIFMAGSDLYAYLECEDFEAVSRKLAADPEVARWEQYMAPLMETTRVDEEGEGTRLLEEVFHLD